MATKDRPLMTPDQVHNHFKDNRDVYTNVHQGLGSIYTTTEHTLALKALAGECLDLMSLFEEKYAEVYQSLNQTRTKKVNPKFVDLNLVRFLSDYFEVPLPESGKYGVLDLNSTAHRAFSVYIREKDLNNKQFFTLDEGLKKLFNSPSLEDPSKTYLQLTQERVDELAKDKKEITSSCSNIIHHDGGISMNVAALKILVPKFGIDYAPADADKYVPEINDFIELLAERFEKAKARQTSEAQAKKEEKSE